MLIIRGLVWVFFLRLVFLGEWRTGLLLGFYSQKKVRVWSLMEWGLCDTKKIHTPSLPSPPLLLQVVKEKWNWGNGGGERGGGKKERNQARKTKEKEGTDEALFVSC